MSNITYKWSILGVITEKEFHQYQDFIYACIWQLTGTNQDGKSESISDRVGFSLPSESYPYTPRSEMTEEKMVAWVKDILGAEKIAELESQIESILNQE
jgi:hypothetical protein